MAFFIVTMVHPDGPAWGAHVAAHVRYLEGLVREGTLRASGPLRGTPKRSGFLVFKTASRDAVERCIANDPFAIEGVIDSLTIEEWDPLFGAFAAESSGKL